MDNDCSDNLPCLDTGTNSTNRSGEASECQTLLPPEAIYETQSELWESIQAWAASRGYCFRIGRSKSISKTERKIYYTCDRYGKPPSKDPTIPQRRKSATRKTHCQFSIVAVQIKAYWEIRHRDGDKYSKHNHFLSDGPISHPGHRKGIRTQQHMIRSTQYSGT